MQSTSIIIHLLDILDTIYVVQIIATDTTQEYLVDLLVDALTTGAADSAQYGVDTPPVVLSGTH